MKDSRDAVAMAMVCLTWLASTAWVFLHPSDVSYGTWVAGAATYGGIFHWLCIRDDKTPDHRDG